MKLTHESTPDDTTLRSRVVERSPVYFGWLVLVAGTVGMMMTTPGQTVGVSVFLDRIIADLGLSRSHVSLLYTIGTLVGSFSLPYVGRVIDRRGPRASVVVIASLFAGACVWMGGVVTGTVTLLIGFILIRGLGQGSLGLVSLHVVNIWFVRRRGLAVGVFGLGMAAATAFFPSFINRLIDSFGWRLAYPLLGVMVAAVVIPLGLLFYRSHPERYGLVPDGRARSGSPTPPERSYSLPEARRTVTFWLFSSGGFLTAALGTGLVFHHFSIMAESGLGREAAASMFITFGFVQAATNLGTGALLDHIQPRFALAGSLAAMAAAMGMATQATSPGLVLVYGTLLGTMQGMSQAIQGSVYAHYFGRVHLGAIKGFASTLMIAGTSVGPLLLAVGFEASGSYTPVLYGSAIAPLAIGLAAMMIRLRPTTGAVR